MIMPTVKTVKRRTIEPTRSAVSPRRTFSFGVAGLIVSPKIEIEFHDFFLLLNNHNMQLKCSTISSKLRSKLNFIQT